MLEPEIAFGDLFDCMDLAEDYLKFLIEYILENNKDDLKFFDERIKKG
jgi:asparaginyl-tRNA synthetase